MCMRTHVQNAESWTRTPKLSCGQRTTAALVLGAVRCCRLRRWRGRCAHSLRALETRFAALPAAFLTGASALLVVSALPTRKTAACQNRIEVGLHADGGKCHGTGSKHERKHAG